MKKGRDIRELAASWRLGLLSPGEMPSIAGAMLSDSHCSESLIRLSMCEPAESDEIEKLFQQALTEAGCESMPVTQALREYARKISKLILSNNLSPFEGAASIWRATLCAGDLDFHELDTFVYAASEMDDGVADKAPFEDAIREEAKHWASEDPPSKIQPTTLN